MEKNTNDTERSATVELVERHRKEAVLSKLLEYVQEHKQYLWEQWEYRFIFPHINKTASYSGDGKFQKGAGIQHGKYYWKEKEIYLTAAEELHLYERLILNLKPRNCTISNTLKFLRKRFQQCGLDGFLKEIFPLMPQKSRKGVTTHGQEKKEWRG